MSHAAHHVVTGGAGFIGTNLVFHLLDALPNATFTIIDKLNYASSTAALQPAIDTGRVTLEIADIADRAAIHRIFTATNPVGVWHLAAESHVDRSISGPAPFIHSNVVGTFTLLDVCRELWADDRTPRRFLHVSTDEVYGSLELDEERLFREDSAYDPSSPYSASKASSDHLARAYARTYGLDIVITNCSNNFGPYQYPDKLIPLMIRNIRDDKPLPVYGDGKHVRDWLFVRDHCEALHAVFDHGRPGRSYNIGGDHERPNIEIVETLCDLVDDALGRDRRSRGLITYVADRLGHDRRYGVDTSRIRDELGWTPQTGFADGLAETVTWYLTHLESIWDL